MKYYLEISLLPDVEANLGFLWQKIYQQIHISLVDNKIGENESAVAVAFSRYGEKLFPLGDQLRLFAKTEIQLNELNIPTWLSRFKDYVHIKSIKPVPEKVTHVCFIREHVKGEAGIEKKMQAKAKYWSEKSGQPLDECLLSLEKSKPKARSTRPFIWLESQKTKQRDPAQSSKFPLFIKRIELENPQKGHVNCYGLNANHKDISKWVSVPHF